LIFFAVNLGKWVLRNLFIGFIKEQQRIRRDLSGSQATPSPTESDGRGHEGVFHSRTNVNANAPSSSPTRSNHRRKSSSPEIFRRFPKSFSTNPTFSSNVVICAPDMIPTLPPTVAFPADLRPAPLSAPLIPIRPDEPITGSRGVRVRAETMDSSIPSGRSAAAAASGGAGSRSSTAVPVTIRPSEYFTSSTRRPKTPKYPGGPVFGMGGGQQQTAPDHGYGHAPAEGLRPVTPNAGLMGRLKSIGGKISGRPASAAGSTGNMVKVGGGRSGGAYVAAPPTSSSAATMAKMGTTSDNRKRSGVSVECFPLSSCV
jgi:WD repeat-containing protein 48